jgi:hypothetical protein
VVSCHAPLSTCDVMRYSLVGAMDRDVGADGKDIQSIQRPVATSNTRIVQSIDDDNNHRPSTLKHWESQPQQSNIPPQNMITIPSINVNAPHP